MSHRHHRKRGVGFSRGQRKCRRRLCIALNRVEGLSAQDRQQERQRINAAILANIKYDLPQGKPKRRCVKPTSPAPVKPAPRPAPKPALQSPAHQFNCGCIQCMYGYRPGLY